MTGRADQAAQTRAAREAFEYALEHNVTVPEACEALARRRWAEVEARLAVKRRCGTRADMPMPAPASRQRFFHETEGDWA